MNFLCYPLSKPAAIMGRTNKQLREPMRLLNPISQKLNNMLREKAIKRAKTRILIAGKKPEEFSPEDLEVIVQEEESNIKSDIRDKGLLAVLALLGLSWFG